AIADIDAAAAFGVLRAVIARKGDIETVVGPEQQLAAQTEVVLPVDPVATGDVIDRAAAIGARNRNTRGEVFRQRPGNRGLGLLEAVVAEADLGAAFEIEGRLIRSDVDRARGGVLAVERALRP